MATNQFTEGQRVRLVMASQEMLDQGLKVGMIGTVHIHAFDDHLGKTPLIGVGFDGHSDTGSNAGLHVTLINTKIDGKTFPVIDLCEALAPAKPEREYVRKQCDHIWNCVATAHALIFICETCGRKTQRPYTELRQDAPIFPRVPEGQYRIETFREDDYSGPMTGHKF